MQPIQPQPAYVSLAAHGAFAVQGVFIQQAGGVWISNNPQLAAQLIAARDMVADERAIVAAAIKSHARERILAIVPEWKQSNLLARMNELLKARLIAGQWSESEAGEVAALESVWSRVKSIRAASDAHEAAVAQLGTVAAVLAYDWRGTGWPE